MSITGIIIAIIVGAIAGAIAKAIMPGKDPGGIIITILLGIVGAVIGNVIGQTLIGRGTGPTDFSIPGILLAVVGALVVLAVYRLATGRSMRA